MIVEISEIAKASRAGLVKPFMTVTMIIRTCVQGLPKGASTAQPHHPLTNAPYWFVFENRYIGNHFSSAV